MTLILVLAAAPVAADTMLTGAPSESGMRFGTAVAMSSADVIAVGAPSYGGGKGAAYIFRPSSGSWVQEAFLTEPLAASDVAFYGRAIAIHEDDLAVGSPVEDVSSMQDRGAVHLYRFAGGQWIKSTTLVAPGGAAGDTFGNSLGLDGDFLIAGAPGVNGSQVDAGRAYLWRRASADSWVFHQTLRPPSDRKEDRFGDRVAISGDFVFVSAPWRDETATDSGVIYVFKKAANGTFAPHQTLNSPAGDNNDRFGSDLAAAGDFLVVGSPGIEGPAQFSGTAFVFRKASGTWSQDGPALSSPTAHAFDVFGRSVAIRGTKIVVGASGDNAQGSGAGAAFTFERSSEGWAHAGRTTASGVQPLRTLGDAVAVGNFYFAAGAPMAGDGGTVHAFRSKPDPLIFLPGIAGSVLARGVEQLWPTINADKIAQLALPESGAPIVATDIFRTFDPLVLSLGRVNIYGEYLEDLVEQRDYVEYDFGGDRSRLFDAEHMKAQEPSPTLFPFPYDWRKSNAESAAELHLYIKAIRELYPGQKLNIVAHSMGGLVTRRYLLNRKDDDAIGQVATVGTPFWGAPVAVYRMVKGQFFDKLLVDPFANESVRGTLRTLPGFHELLPTDLYQQVKGEAVIFEDGRTGNSNNTTDDQYDLDDFWSFIDRQVEPDKPASQINRGFHTDEQADWRNDPETVRYLHITGKSRKPTTTRISLVERPSYDLAKVTARYQEIQGIHQGDGVVPLLSAQRQPDYLAPDTTVEEVYGRTGATHDGMMRNPAVWEKLHRFFNNLPGDEAPMAAPATGDDLFETTQERITILGASWARIENEAGDWNEPVGDLGYLPIPELDISYGAPDEWMEIAGPVGHWKTLDGSAASGTVEIEVHTLDTDGTVLRVQRFRFSPGQAAWRLAKDNEDLRLFLDGNGNSSFEPGEEVAPTHDLSGPGIDVVPPSLTITIEKTPGGISLDYAAADDSGAPSIRYRVDDGVAQPFTAPLVFPDPSLAVVRCVAEDAAGNLSGFMETTVNPDLAMQPGGAAGVVMLEWPVADGYLLEESPDLKVWQPSPGSIQRDGNRLSIRLGPVEGKRFFRLRSASLER